MSTTIDINVTKIEPIVTITAEPNEYIVNINNGGGGGDFLPLAGGTMDEGADIFFDNGSKLSEGIVDAGTGGNKGIALTCAVGYEWKWEAGEAYLTNLSGNFIDLKQYARSVPLPTDDNTKGFYAGSEWFTLTGSRYNCADATTDNAVWQLVDNIPNLGQVLTVGDREYKEIGENYYFQIEDRLKKLFIVAGANTLRLEDDGSFPVHSTIPFTIDGDYTLEAIDTDLRLSSDLTTTVTEVPLTSGDVCELYKASEDPIWVLTITNKSSGGVTSVGLTMPSAFTVTNSPITSSGDIAVTGAGTVSQYVRGDGSLANFPTSSGGGASLSFYLNGSVSQGTFGGVAFREMDRTPILGAGTNFNINTNGYIQSFITDAGVPNLLEIPAGNWNFETYFSASSGGGTPSFYIELYKWDGVTLSLIASSSANPEGITNGTVTDLYVSALAVPQTTLLATDRLAVRIWVNNSGRTITLHTEDNNLCQVITTFSTGLTALNGLTAQVQNLAVGTSGTDFAINSTTSTHTFNLPTASASNRGALSSTDWSTFNNKQNNLRTFQTTQGVYYFNEFMGNLQANVSASTNNVINVFGNGQGTTRTTGTITNRTNQQGVIESLTSANNTGQAGWQYGGTALFIGTGAITLETYVNITTLSTLAERFYTFFGYATGSNYANILNNIAIVYDEGGVYLSANASPNFKCITRAGSTITTTVTSIAVTAGQWYKLRIVINAAASSVEFYIDNVLRATHTTNIPLTTTPMFIGNGIVKTTGSTARAMQTDYFMYEEIFTNPR
jgi:hypothetical protein